MMLLKTCGSRLRSYISPQNVFFPKRIVTIHQSEWRLPKTTVELRIAADMGKQELKQYLEVLYGARVNSISTRTVVADRNREYDEFEHARYKVARINTEIPIIRQIKSYTGTKEYEKNPYLVDRISDSPETYDNRKLRPTQHWSNVYAPRHEQAWREPLSILFRDEFLPPKTQPFLEQDYTKPYEHMGSLPVVPAGTPVQFTPSVEFEEMAKKRRAILGPRPPYNPLDAHVLNSRKKLVLSLKN